MKQFCVAEYTQLFDVCTHEELERFSNDTVAVAEVVCGRILNAAYPAFSDQAALNTSMRILSALSRCMRGRNMTGTRDRVVRQLALCVDVATRQR